MDYLTRQRQISFVKSSFAEHLSTKLNLCHVQGPILSRVGDGTQDNLSGAEKAVQVKVKAIPNATFEVVHSLAKWKRRTLGQQAVRVGCGIYVDMKALRPDEDALDATHSVYVDQWDWELVMAPTAPSTTTTTAKSAPSSAISAPITTKGEVLPSSFLPSSPPPHRTLAFLKHVVTNIYDAMKATEADLIARSPSTTPSPPTNTTTTADSSQGQPTSAFTRHRLPPTITFIHAEELLQMFPDVKGGAKGRERAAAKAYGAIFLVGVGGLLSNGEAHDGRAPDYDDWSTAVDAAEYTELAKYRRSAASVGEHSSASPLRFPFGGSRESMDGAADSANPQGLSASAAVDSPTVTTTTTQASSCDEIKSSSSTSFSPTISSETGSKPFVPIAASSPSSPSSGAPPLLTTTTTTTTPTTTTFAGLNGDIIVWNAVLEDALELSSMGIRVDPEALLRQFDLTAAAALRKQKKNDDKETEMEGDKYDACDGDVDASKNDDLTLPRPPLLDWHHSLLRGEMPQTIGGGIGQSRLVMHLLGLSHVGQVQCGVWGDEVFTGEGKVDHVLS